MLFDLAAVHGRNEKQLQPIRSRHAVPGERLGRHERSEVGAADADIDHGVDRHPGIAAPLPGVDALDELLHALERRVNFACNIVIV